VPLLHNAHKAFAKTDRLANAVGTEEPEYGAGAIQTVTAQAEKTPYTELTKSDLKWKAQDDSTNVETQTFYFFSDEGKVASVQVIHNNVSYVQSSRPNATDALLSISTVVGLC
jgi:hypothetical protein